MLFKYTRDEYNIPYETRSLLVRVYFCEIQTTYILPSRRAEPPENFIEKPKY